MELLEAAPYRACASRLRKIFGTSIAIVVALTVMEPVRAPEARKAAVAGAEAAVRRCTLRQPVPRT